MSREVAAALPFYGFPEPLMNLVDHAFPGNSGPCGVCGDTILGGRHRVIDAIAERFVLDDDPQADYGITDHQVAVAVAASYEFREALARQRRAERKAARSSPSVTPTPHANNADSGADPIETSSSHSRSETTR